KNSLRIESSESIRSVSVSLLLAQFSDPPILFGYQHLSMAWIWGGTLTATASRRLYIVALSSEDLDLQLIGHGRDSFTFAVGVDAESPGLGRVAVIVTHSHVESTRITHLGWVKAVGRRQNMDRTLELSAV